MGAWSVMWRRLPELLPEGVELRYVGRPQRASPSEGYPAAHRKRAGADRPHRPGRLTALRFHPLPLG